MTFRQAKHSAKWAVKKLSEVCFIKPPRSEARSKLQPSDLVTFMPMEDLGICSKITTPIHIRKLSEVQGSYTYFAEDDVLLAKITPCFENGKLGIAKNLENGIGFGSSEYIVLRPHDDLFNEYLFYYLSQESFRTEGAKRMSGAVGHKRVAKDFIEDFTIPLPLFEEQKRIVSILDEAFSDIERAKKNAEKNLANAKELFESYLNKVFATPGPDWEEKKLEDIAHVFGRGKSKHRPRNWKGLFGGDYPFIQTGEIRNANKYVSEYTQTYNDVGLAQSKLWKKGTICITIAANIAETAILGFDACFPDSIIGLEIDFNKADLDYTYYVLQFFKSELQKLGKGSAQDNINLGTFENQYFPFPKSVEEQRAIVLRINALRSETQKFETIYQRKILALAELKKSILKKAFEGSL